MSRLSGSLRNGLRGARTQRVPERASKGGLSSPLTFPLQRVIPRLRAGLLLLNGCWQEILLHTPVFQQVQRLATLARIAATATQICSQGGIDHGSCQNGAVAPPPLPTKGGGRKCPLVSLYMTENQP